MTEEEQIKEFEDRLAEELVKLITESGPVVNNAATRNVFTDFVQTRIDAEVAAGRMEPNFGRVASDKGSRNKREGEYLGWWLGRHHRGSGYRP